MPLRTPPAELSTTAAAAPAASDADVTAEVARLTKENEKLRYQVLHLKRALEAADAAAGRAGATATVAAV